MDREHAGGEVQRLGGLGPLQAPGDELIAAGGSGAGGVEARGAMGNWTVGVRTANSPSASCRNRCGWPLEPLRAHQLASAREYRVGPARSPQVDCGEFEDTLRRRPDDDLGAIRLDSLASRMKVCSVPRARRTAGDRVSPRGVHPRPLGGSCNAPTEPKVGAPTEPKCAERSDHAERRTPRAEPRWCPARIQQRRPKPRTPIELSQGLEAPGATKVVRMPQVPSWKPVRLRAMAPAGRSPTEAKLAHRPKPSWHHGRSQVC